MIMIYQLLMLLLNVAFFIMLATRSWNVISLDNMLFPSRNGSQNT